MEAYAVLATGGKQVLVKVGDMVEIEGVVVHDVLTQTLKALFGAHFAYSVEPFQVAPHPYARGKYVGQHERVHQFGKDEYLHVGERRGR